MNQLKHTHYFIMGILYCNNIIMNYCILLMLTTKMFHYSKRNSIVLRTQLSVKVHTIIGEYSINSTQEKFLIYGRAVLIFILSETNVSSNELIARSCELFWLYVLNIYMNSTC